jgi:hypothetical protein
MSVRMNLGMDDMNLRGKDRPSMGGGSSRFLSAFNEGFDEAGATWEDFYNKTTENNTALMEGDINVGQRVLRSTGDTVGLIGGLFGDVLGVAGDLVAADEFGVEAAYQKYIEKPLQEAIMSASSTDVGKKVVKFAKENDELMTDLGAISNVALLSPVGKIANSTVRNMPTQVEGFYSGDPLKMVAGLALAGASGAKNALLSSFNPKALAFQNKTGLTKGTVEQAKKAEALVKRRLQLEKNLKNATSEYKGAGSYRYSIGEARKELEAFDAKHKGFGSYTEGALAYAYLYGKQVGEEPSEFLRENFENLNVLGAEIGPSAQQFNNLVFNKPRLQATATPENPELSLKNQDYLQNRLYTTWEIPDNQRSKTAIVVKDPDKQHSMTDQARMQRSDGTSQFFTNFKDTGIDLKTASPQEVVRAAEGRTLTNIEKDLIRRVNADEKLTQKQRNASVDAIRKLKSEPKLVWHPEQELFIVQDSFKAGAKELGGVNRITTMDRNGNVNVIVSDRHDMLGFDPIDGKPLLTIFPPMQYNIYKGRGKDVYETKESQLAARRRLGSELGESFNTVKPSYTQTGKIKQGSSKRLGGEIVGEYSPIGAEPPAFPKDPIYGSRAGVARRINQRIIQESENYKPTLSELAAQTPRAALNTGLMANYRLRTGELAAGGNPVSLTEEEQ